jgi:hypothetical protein
VAASDARISHWIFSNTEGFAQLREKELFSTDMVDKCTCIKRVFDASNNARVHLIVVILTDAFNLNL